MSECRFIIAGMQRSGTTLLANRLSEAFSLPYLHEPFNPSYGLVQEQKTWLANHVDPVFPRNEMLRFSWRRSSRNPVLSRPLLLSKIIGLFGYDFFIKCPFWYLYEPCIAMQTEKLFVFKSVDEFIRSNLSRGFTFRPLIRSTLPEGGALFDALKLPDDDAVVISVYIHIARHALADEGVNFLFHTADNLAVAISALEEHIEGSHRGDRISLMINRWGRGMMRTGTRFAANRPSQSYKHMLSSSAANLYNQAIELEHEMMDRYTGNTDGERIM